ncbi:MAG: DNA/RNA non-specific endonuclease [Candidatus Pacearchaeota archaeon]|jgi:endonuclease G|nr:DNA/RNA non-specific endonuclease [Clostridia bacterium]
MKKILLILMFAFITLSSFGQKVDTVITTDIYKSYFSYDAKNPLFVVYKLYHGGGTCSRADEHFTFKTDGIKTGQSNKNYSHSGYDIGHMANAEDFAYNCQYEEETFRFYNALPQTVECNRGHWKTIETKVRKQSQNDSLLIICGGFSFEQKDNIIVPAFCYKIIKNLKTGKITCYIFNNDDSKLYEEIPYERLIANIPYAYEIKKLKLLKN